MALLIVSEMAGHTLCRIAPYGEREDIFYYHTFPNS